MSTLYKSIMSTLFKAVIATIYGAGKRYAAKALAEATGLVQGENKEIFKAFQDAIDEKLNGVTAIIRYFERVTKAIAEQGGDTASITLPNGASFSVSFVDVAHTECFVDTDYEGERVHYEFKYKDIDVTGAAKELAAGYIQAFDAFLLAEVQVELSEAGISFYGKHDAYLIDAAHQGELVGIVQRVFHRVFSEDHLGRLKDDIAARYGISVAPVELGSYSVDAVLGSNYLIGQ